MEQNGNSSQAYGGRPSPPADNNGRPSPHTEGGEERYQYPRPHDAQIQNPAVYQAPSPHPPPHGYPHSGYNQSLTYPLPSGYPQYQTPYPPPSGYPQYQTPAPSAYVHYTPYPPPSGYPPYQSQYGPSPGVYQPAPCGGNQIPQAPVGCVTGPPIPCLGHSPAAAPPRSNSQMAFKAAMIGGMLFPQVANYMFGDEGDNDS